MIINSLLDTDFYKFTMGQIVYHKFSNIDVEYKFKCRNRRLNLNISLLNQAINDLCSLSFKEEELDYLRTIPFLKHDYIDFLETFKLNKKYLNVYIKENEFNLHIKGPWVQTIFFETFLLSIINELYFYKYENKIDYKTNLYYKIKKIKEFPKLKFSDFGTRRRFSFYVQDNVIKKLKEKCNENFIGTSNVYFAKKYNLKPIGTMAHEYLQAFQSIVNIRESQKVAFDEWAKEYRGELGIALTDVIGINAFLKDFDLYFCKLFDGCRHDSGDPFLWAEKIIKHYKENKIDPKEKTLIFSDGLNIEKAIEIYKRFFNRINISFGIGTNLTNNVIENKTKSTINPLNIVIKMTKCNNQDVAKISDTPNKSMCESKQYLNYLKEFFYN